MFLTERKLDRRITEIREYSYRDVKNLEEFAVCLLYTSPSPRD